MKRQISNFLQQIPFRYDGITAVIIFGSFTFSDVYRDVDIILVFRNAADVKITRNIAREFKKIFLKDLHIQLFPNYEYVILKSFLTRARSWECIYE